MTREEFMDMVYSELHSDGDNYRANRIIDAADEYVETGKESNWTPVSERLPEKGEVVLITNSKGHVRCGQFRYILYENPSEWCWKGNTVEFVIAWMPLPEPYKEQI